MAYTITATNELTMVQFQSTPTLEELRDAIEKSEGFSSPLELWNLLASELPFTSDQMEGLAELAKAKQHHPQKTAIVAAGDLAYGLTRLYVAYRHQSGNAAMVFRDEHAARRWLFEQNLPPPEP